MTVAAQARACMKRWLHEHANVPGTLIANRPTCRKAKRWALNNLEVEEEQSSLMSSVVVSWFPLLRTTCNTLECEKFV